MSRTRKPTSTSRIGTTVPCRAGGIRVIERLNREIRRRTRVVGTLPDGNSALMMVCARLRHVAGTQWGCKKYMNMKHLEAAIDDAFIAGRLQVCRSLQINLRIILDGTDGTFMIFSICASYCTLSIHYLPAESRNIKKGFTTDTQMLG